jgi:hypothetical protein
MQFNFAIILITLIASIIATPTNYISYGALEADYIPCSQNGDSSANCQTDAQANAYNRGCEAEEECRS